MNKAKTYFNDFMHRHRIKHSVPRDRVLDIFLSCERHVTVNELSTLVHKKYPTIGLTTVYRTLKLICDSGIAREVDFGEGIVRYEHDFGHEHHDHIICTGCGAFKEIQSDEIETAQERIAQQNRYKLSGHKMVLYGICPECGEKNR